jgi:hypothetical protein
MWFYNNHIHFYSRSSIFYNNYVNFSIRNEKKTLVSLEFRGYIKKIIIEYVAFFVQAKTYHMERP